MDLSDYMRSVTKRVDEALKHFLPSEKTKPHTLHRAMRYSMFAGGKRLRPTLCIAAADACGAPVEKALFAACAVECVHTYTLIHDDLPCMDDDDLRRGRPTNHKVFGEGIAVLAGDALNTLAFEILSQGPSTQRYPTATQIGELASASGSRHLIAGQVIDLESEGKTLTPRALQFIHEAKTAALLRCSVRLGGMSANASRAKLKALSDFGHALGLAFQVIDDILDVTQSTEKLGKTAGKDLTAVKATYPALFGLERSRHIAKRLTAKAQAALKPFGKKNAILLALADSMLSREY